MSLPQTREDVIERAKALMPTLRERAARTEELRRIPEETVRDFVDAGILRVGVPLKYGGVSVGYDVMFDVGMELGRACAASAWCYSLWVVHSGSSATSRPRRRRSTSARDPTRCAPARSPAKASSQRRSTAAHRVSGHWEFSSGCDAATWAELGVELPDGNQAWAPSPAAITILSTPGTSAASPAPAAKTSSSKTSSSLLPRAQARGRGDGAPPLPTTNHRSTTSPCAASSAGTCWRRWSAWRRAASTSSSGVPVPAAVSQAVIPPSFRYAWQWQRRK